MKEMTGKGEVSSGRQKQVLKSKLTEVETPGGGCVRYCQLGTDNGIFGGYIPVAKDIPMSRMYKGKASAE